MRLWSACATASSVRFGSRIASTRPGLMLTSSPSRRASEPSRRSASISSTRASGAWARAPARLIAVVVLPSATLGLETATIARSVVLWSCSIRWRSARYCSASNEVGASTLTRCSSSSLENAGADARAADTGRCGGGQVPAEDGTGARSTRGAGAGSTGAVWRRRACSCSACSSALKNLLMGSGDLGPIA